MKKIILMLVSVLVINACTSTKNIPFNEVEASLNQKYAALSNEYYKMLENPIVEKDRRNILNKFESFRTEVKELKKNRKDQTGNETRVLNSFIDKSSTNIQYLNDLSE
ncbi:hypothetical protein [Fusobacterium polymorphum]|uniref:hypothetical protein n=1 Tax=Fusobacterium nucleatum subsp. polymorphum TaxID=76857 RepID=UPI001EEFEEC0|nr:MULTISPECIES: hypothetical protein [Fusobacterium]MCG6837776.1 hypothetical protein [Fusobacterium nucleatum]WRL70944.1 hypothetical protein VKN81_00640 [Fusobacterium polymorphum]